MTFECVEQPFLNPAAALALHADPNSSGADVAKVTRDQVFFVFCCLRPAGLSNSGADVAKVTRDNIVLFCFVFLFGESDTRQGLRLKKYTLE